MTRNICFDCEQPYGEGGCKHKYVNGLPINPYGSEKYWTADWNPPGSVSETCHDCGCFIGEYHHHACDMAECPFCDGQLLACRGEH